MVSRTRLTDRPAFVWMLLAVPSMPMMAALAFGAANAGELLHVSGEFAGRFMIVAMMATPLRMLFPRVRWIGWLVRRRRAIGVAAFGYAALHTALYVIDMEELRHILAEFWALGIWTGWAAAAILLPLALTSNDASMRAMRQGWKLLHRWVYAAALLTLAHWIFVENNLGSALVHFLPLAALETYRLVRLHAATKPAAVR